VSAAPTGDATFVLCIENNAIRAQALLLCESIRTFGGRHRDAPIVAVSPRPGLGIDAGTRRQLDSLSVAYVEEPLNRMCPEYGSANRVFAAAWAEPRARTPWVVVLDSDTVVLDDIDLPAGADAAVRPVDTKGSATEGPGDAFEPYWEQLAALQRVPLSRMPFVHTTVSGHRVRASYNGGLVAVRREAALLHAWADLFSRSLEAGLKPWRGSGLNVHASTGPVGEDASEYWGSNQAAAALAIWSTTTRVALFSAAYNVPLHLLIDDAAAQAWPRSGSIAHVHYHWLFAEHDCGRALARLGDLGAPPDRVDWLRARLPLTLHD
jgi:hypothetical protein